MASAALPSCAGAAGAALSLAACNGGGLALSALGMPVEGLGVSVGVEGIGPDAPPRLALPSCAGAAGVELTSAALPPAGDAAGEGEAFTAAGLLSTSLALPSCAGAAGVGLMSAGLPAGGAVGLSARGGCAEGDGLLVAALALPSCADAAGLGLAPSAAVLLLPAGDAGRPAPAVLPVEGDAGVVLLVGTAVEGPSGVWLGKLLTAGLPALAAGWAGCAGLGLLLLPASGITTGKSATVLLGRSAAVLLGRMMAVPFTRVALVMLSTSSWTGAGGGLLAGKGERFTTTMSTGVRA